MVLILEMCEISVNFLKKKTGDLDSPISPICKTSFFGEGFKK